MSNKLKKMLMFFKVQTFVKKLWQIAWVVTSKPYKN